MHHKGRRPLRNFLGHFKQSRFKSDVKIVFLRMSIRGLRPFVRNNVAPRSSGGVCDLWKALMICEGNRAIWAVFSFDLWFKSQMEGWKLNVCLGKKKKKNWKIIIPLYPFATQHPWGYNGFISKSGPNVGFVIFLQKKKRLKKKERKRNKCWLCSK